MTDHYPPDSTANHPDTMQYGYETDDDGTMPENVEALAAHVVGRRIVSAEDGRINPGPNYYGRHEGLILTLDNGIRVLVADTNDCCAHTTLDKFLLHPERVEHVITGVATTDGYTKWHIFADYGDVLELDVSWSCGNPFYYGYGFDIVVEPIDGTPYPELSAGAPS